MGSARWEGRDLTLRILLVDDHAMLREGLRSILRAESDVEVVGEAADGNSAVELAHTLAPDVVVMDVGMSGLNGMEATRRIRAGSPGARVIALSTHSDRRYVLGMLEAGAAGYVVKVSAYDELRQAVRTVASGRVYLSPQIADVVLTARVATSPTGAAKLGSREREVLQLIAEGHRSPEIAQRLHISTHTVETHRRNLMQKLGLHSVADLTRYAIREGITQADH
jgi:two-component system NarL family response regulator